MNLSGILVIAAPGRFDEALAALATLPGIEVHHADAATSRAVVVQEAPTVDAEVEGLRRIQALPPIASAELVYHYFADDPLVAGGKA